MGRDQDLVAADAGGGGTLGEIGDRHAAGWAIGHADAQAAIAVGAIVREEGVELDRVIGGHAVSAAGIIDLQVAIGRFHRDGMIDGAIIGDIVGAVDGRGAAARRSGGGQCGGAEQIVAES